MTKFDSYFDIDFSQPNLQSQGKKSLRMDFGKSSIAKISIVKRQKFGRNWRRCFSGYLAKDINLCNFQEDCSEARLKRVNFICKLQKC